VISILIPIYNFDIRKLVLKLNAEAIQKKIVTEILCIDDASDLNFKDLNTEISDFEHVRYLQLEKNIGRSAIRNRLAEEAKFDFLLFIDCDTIPETENYLEIYFKNLKPGSVLYGGRSYQKNIPEKDFYFHWLYGSRREVASVAQRNLQPYQRFMTNNFLIDKIVFLKIKFDEQIRKYGHEDTLFGLELKNRGIEIIHLDNPMQHIGLEKSETFIQKTEQACDNLLMISQKQDLKKEIKLLRYFLWTGRLKIHFILLFFYRIFKKIILSNLNGKKPSLLLFDLYKLGYMIEKSKKRTS
jgi:glycosyltransferase involved in cell wall biosynthesis